MVIDPIEQNIEKAAEWARNALRGTGIEGVYTGIEMILKDILIECDGEVFAAAESWHQQLLAQAAQPTSDRTAIISDTVYKALDEIRRFRHVERNLYRHEFRETDVVRNLGILKSVFPGFIAEVDQFMKTWDPPASVGSTPPP